MWLPIGSGERHFLHTPLNWKYWYMELWSIFSGFRVFYLWLWIWNDKILTDFFVKGFYPGFQISIHVCVFHWPCFLYRVSDTLPRIPAFSPFPPPWHLQKCFNMSQDLKTAQNIPSVSPVFQSHPHSLFRICTLYPNLLYLSSSQTILKQEPPCSLKASHPWFSRTA